MDGRLVLCALVLTLASALAAQGQTPVGGEFRVDTRGDAPQITSGRSPRQSAAAPDGDFVVTWEAGNVPGGELLDVLARRFDGGGAPLGAEFLVNTATAGDQVHPAVGFDDTGGFVVVWQSGTLISGQRFDPAGVRRGAEFPVSDAGALARWPSVSVAPAGGFVVVWNEDDGNHLGVFGRRYAADGSPLGTAFLVNTYTTGFQTLPAVEMDAAGNFVVTWTNRGLIYGYRFSPAAQMFSAAGARIGGEFAVSSATVGNQERPRIARSRGGSFVIVWHALPGGGVQARRFDATGAPIGADFQVDPGSTQTASEPEIDADADGDFVVTWKAEDAGSVGIFGRRFDAAGVPGPAFRANTYTTGQQFGSSVASDAHGNFVVTWLSAGQVTPDAGVFAQRYAHTLAAAALAVDPTGGPSSDGNHVLEPGETVVVAPSWRNTSVAAATFTGAATSFTGPGTSGNPTYTIADGVADYGTVPANGSTSCTSTGNCYGLGITVPSVRPAAHWDAHFREEIAPATFGAVKTWDLHVGESFTDVTRANPFYRFVETLLHHGVTGGCTTSAFCPAASTTRAQMAVFVLVAKERDGYAPPACGVTPLFADVPSSSPLCPWIEELARRGVVAGCGGGNYCPASGVSREQMAVFVLRMLDPALNPPACAPPNLFADVPDSSAFCRWIEELANRGVVGGCGGGSYCPAAPVSREQMGVFLSLTFGLQLYAP